MERGLRQHSNIIIYSKGVIKNMSVQLELMNFRVPVDVRETFSSLCKFNRRSMSSQLIEMMKNYIEVEGKKTLNSIKNNEDIIKTLNKTSERINQKNMSNHSSEILSSNSDEDIRYSNGWLIER